MKYILTFFLTLLLVSLSACSGGGGSPAPEPQHDDKEMGGDDPSSPDPIDLDDTKDLDDDKPSTPPTNEDIVIPTEPQHDDKEMGGNNPSSPDPIDHDDTKDLDDDKPSTPPTNEDIVIPTEPKYKGPYPDNEKNELRKFSGSDVAHIFPKPMSSVEFVGDFETCDPYNSWLERQSAYEFPRNEENYAMVTDIVREGNCAARITVSKDDDISNGIRAELVYGWVPERFHGLNEEVWYAWSFYIPEDFVDAPSLRDEEGIPYWHLFGQFHQRPNESIGETWLSLKKIGLGEGTPPLAIGYNYITNESYDPEVERVKADLAERNVFGYDPTLANQEVISLVYGGPPETVAVYPIEKGQWYDLVFHVKWSQEDDGFVEAWINGESLSGGKIYGLNMFNNVPNFFKLGQYRNPNMEPENSVYYDNFVIARE